MVCGGDYEHVLGFGTGAANEARAITYRATALGPLSRLVLGGDPFDAAEYSLANYIMLKDRGDARLSAIPVFPSRAFRNASVFVTIDSPLRDPLQLAGKKVGISDYAMTTAVWTRGHLFDDTGLDWRDIEWVTGLNPRFPAPQGVRATEIASDLETLLLEGKIEALMAGRPRDSLLPPAQRRLRYLVDDAEAIEKRYYAETGLFPIMHTVVLHERLMADPSAAKRVFDTYVQTKKLALKRRLGTTFLPGADRDWERHCPPGGEDPYTHGLTRLNRRNIEALSTCLLQQNLIRRMPDIETLFVPGSAAWADR